MPLEEDINELIYNIPFFDQPVKNKQEVYKNVSGMSRKNCHTTENLSGYLYDQKYYQLIGFNLSRQTNTSIAQQINFVRKLEDDLQQCFLSLKSKKKLF